MVFLLQPRPIMLAERKPVAPTLLSDPAFSTDPSAHPYAVRTTHEPWLSSPPPGHPTLNSKSRRRRSGDDPASDSEPFHIIPPPNSPVNFAPQSTTPFSVPHHVVTETVGTHSQSTSSLTTAAEPLSESKQSHHWQPNLSPAPITTAPTPATPRRRITLMTILKRRSTQQPQSVASVNSIPRKALTSSKSLSNKADVTRIHAKPNRVSNEEVIPPKPVTLGNSMPPIPSTMHPTTTYRVVDIPTNRLENLDRIDELDETNPWGIGFHHGGPYEAAAEAIRGKVQKVFPGHGSYNRGAPHSNDNVDLSLPNLHRLLTSLLGLFSSSGNGLVFEFIAWSDSPKKLSTALYPSFTASTKLHSTSAKGRYDDAPCSCSDGLSGGPAVQGGAADPGLRNTPGFISSTIVSDLLNKPNSRCTTSASVI